MSKEKILIIEDESAIQELLDYNLRKEGYTELRSALSGERGLEIAREFLPDLILLDLMLPGMDGLSVCRKLKSSEVTSDIPVIMLTAKGEESDIIVGLEMGADDYVTKPFSTKLLIARIRAVLRRRGGELESDYSEGELRRGPLLLNNGTRLAQIDGKLLNLTCSEFDLLYLLARKPGWVFTRSRIVNEIRGGDYPVTERAIDVQVVGLRKKLGEFAPMIETIRGVGYRFNAEEL